MKNSDEKLNQLKDELGKEFKNPSLIRMDLTTRILYSTDASIYQIQPLGVVFPRTDEEMVAAVNMCSTYGIPVLARGGGSSLAGQAIGEAIIIDCSRYLDRILSISPEEKFAYVQPGVVLDDLNRQLNVSGLQFGPDPASSERATIGGSIGNNATGAHSISYGMAVDHLLAVDLILSDGSETNFDRVTLEKARIKAQENSIEGKIFRQALKIRENLKTEIMTKWPKTWRNASGYNLNYLLPWSSSKPTGWQNCIYPPVQPNELNLAHLIAGSEGTLGIMKSIKLNLVPVPKVKKLAILPYASIDEACDDVPNILHLQPSAIELIPKSILSAAKSVPAYAHKAGFVAGDPEAILIVEFAGQDEKEVINKLKNVGKNLTIADTQEQQKNIWSVRKVGLGILQSKPGEIKPIAFIEDIAVPVEKLGHFVREINKIVFEFGGTACEIYAHASAGCLHIRPLLNLKEEEGIKRLRLIADHSTNLAIQLGGTISGEHGDGIARAEWLERQYGPVLLQAFRDLKKSADPNELLNPGKKVSLSSKNEPPPMDSNLRYGEGYITHAWEPVMSFKAEEGLAGAIEQCNGAGVCRKSSGVMCPSFQASKEEIFSTRGRANLLRAFISGKFPRENQAEKVIYETLDLCLACKGCKSECPSSVDLAKLKYEFMAEYYQAHKRKFRDYLFGYIHSFSRIGYPFRIIINFFMERGWVKDILDKYIEISNLRHLPRFAQKSLIHLIGKEYYQQPKDYVQNHSQVVLLVDSFTEFFFPEIGLSAIKVIEKMGFSVGILPVSGAGRTLISKGFLLEARNHAKRVLKNLKEMDPENKALVVGIEPSEIYTLRDEYLDFFEGEAYAVDVANRSWMIDEFLIRVGLLTDPRIKRIASREDSGEYKKHHIGFHGHCYQKARPPSTDGQPIGTEASLVLLESLGYDVEFIDSGCCGMAGAFGYEKEHYQFSLDVADDRLIPAINAMPKETIIVTPGFSCHSQIQDRTLRRVLHPIQLIAFIDD